MHSKVSRVLTILPLAFGVALAFGGCASSTDAGVASDQSNLTAQQPITLNNYLTHPRIVAVRNVVAEIDRLPLTKKENPGCDGSNTKFSDDAGKIRHLVEDGGEDGTFGRSDAYYDASGKLRFFLNVSGDMETHKASESRVWIENDAVLIEVVRDGVLPDGSMTPDFTGARDRLPRPEEAFQMSVAKDAGLLDPETAFEGTGCAPLPPPAAR